jgi:hypothetical protein
MTAAAVAARFDASPPWTTDLVPRLETRAPIAQFIGHRATLLDQIDDRARPRETELWINELSLTDADLRDLLTFFADRNTPWATRLAGSLQHAVTGSDPSVEAMADVATRATGLPGLLEVWADRIASDDAPNTATCRAFVDTLAIRLPVRASIFYHPPMAPWSSALRRCEVVDPLYTRVLEARLLADLGHSARALERIDRLLDDGLPEPVRQELEALVDELAGERRVR